MTLQEKIGEDLIQSIQNRNFERRNFLRVVASELTRGESKVKSDEETLKELINLRKNATEMGNQYEIDILNEYLPQMLNEKETMVLVVKIITDNNITTMKEIGKLMGKVKQLPEAAMIDNSIVSKIAKELLS